MELIKYFTKSVGKIGRTDSCMHAIYVCNSAYIKHLGVINKYKEYKSLCDLCHLSTKNRVQQTWIISEQRLQIIWT